VKISGGIDANRAAGAPGLLNHISRACRHCTEKVGLVKRLWPGVALKRAILYIASDSIVVDGHCSSVIFLIIQTDPPALNCSTSQDPDLSVQRGDHFKGHEAHGHETIAKRTKSSSPPPTAWLIAFTIRSWP